MKRAVAICNSSSFVQLMGLEPTPKYMDMNLNHARMPIPPQLQAKDIISVFLRCVNSKFRELLILGVINNRGD